jgi:WhiB family transcriptional regulator, redox-sensing transcriptional regulator
VSAIDVVILNTAEWMAEAVCASADPEQWFPEKGVSAHQAKRICATCPVIDECLRFALDNDEIGVWGGTSQRERQMMLRRAS